MGTVRTMATFVSAAILCSFGAVPAAHAASVNQSRPGRSATVITVSNSSGYEDLPTCSNTPPYPCGRTALSLEFRVYTSRMFSRPITIGWQLVNGTATAGQDFSGPTTGSVTIAANTVNNAVYIPLVYDGVGEPNETFTVRLTSSSVPADLRATGTETILDGSRVPADCSLAKTAPDQESLSCTGRPAGQQWYLLAYCYYPLGDPELVGNVVTGNGTSAGTCNIGSTTKFGAVFVVLA